LLDAGASLVESFCEEGGPILFVALVWDDRSDAARSGGGSVGFGGISLVGDDATRLDVRADVEQDIEVTRIRSLAASQVEAD
jgi:hypothetical protein